MSGGSITLALDTATPWLVLGLSGTAAGGGPLRLESAVRVERAHAERLAGEVAALFEQAARPVRADQVVIGLGPGSYTGVRVGASYALGLARAWGVPTVGVSTLEAIAAREHGGLVAASLDARKGQVYGGIYEVRGGVVTAERLPADKYPQAEFEARAAGLPRLHDQAPSGLGLADLAGSRGQTQWQLLYL